MPEEDAYIAILFADVSGSTGLYETLGNKQALKRIDQCLARLTRLVEDHGGRVIKTIGDEIMCTFHTADAAVKAASSMQTERAKLIASGVAALRIRLGLHFGQIIREGGDVFGDAVNVASRVASMAKADQIITTRQTVEALSPALSANVRSLGRVPVKGRREEIEICEVVWHGGGDLTLMLGVDFHGLTNAVRLRLRHRGQELTLGRERPAAILGRDLRADLAVSDPLASRQHARIELRGGKFILADQSTNGTYVVSAAGKKTFLHREELPLTEAGIIGMGHAAEAGSDLAIHFDFDH
jgi:class 3 adenylate cyclase